MRIPRWPMVLLPLLLVLPSPARSERRPSYRVVLAQPRANPGEAVALTLVPPVAPGTRVLWSNAVPMVGGGGEAVYRAPFVIAPGTAPARVDASVVGPGVRTTVHAEIPLVPGSVDGSDECLGPGQSYSPATGSMVPDERPLDMLPQLIGSIAPYHPTSDQVRAAGDTLLLRVLVCRTGRVLTAHLLPTFAGPFDPRPVAHDPATVEAAIMEMRQYLFMPAYRAGQPVAAWVSMRYPPPR